MTDNKGLESTNYWEFSNSCSSFSNF